MIFRNNLVSLLDTTMNHTSSLLGAISRTLDETNAEEQFALMEAKANALFSKGSDLFSSMGGFLKQIRENANLFVVRAEYDESKETVDYDVKDNVLTVTISSSSKNSQTSKVTTATIPEECDVTKMKVKVNQKKKLIAFIFPKTNNN